MRLIVLAAASALALAACTPSAPTASDGAATDGATTETAAEPDAHAGHDAAMDATMKAADSADDASSLVTPDGYTFHTFPKKIEIVRLPQDGKGVWQAHGYAESDIFAMLDSRDQPLANGKTVHAIRFEMIASGNGKVVFEKRATANPDDPVSQILTVNFMIH